MSTYRFRLHFEVSSGVHFDEGEVSFVADGHRYQLAPGGNASSVHKTALVIDTDDFASEDEARQAGEKMVMRLLLTTTRLTVGLDVPGPDEHDGETLALPANEGQIVEDVDGLNVYRVYGPFKFGHHYHFNPTMGAGELAEALATVAPGAHLEGRLRTAHEIFAAALGHHRSFIRFLFLVAVLDCLAECRPRGERTQALIEQVRTALENSDLDCEDRKYLDQKLVEAQRESITSAIRRIVVDTVGESYHGIHTRRLVSECYAIRSKIVHEGQYEHPGIAEHESTLAHLVSDVLRRQVRLHPG